MNTGEKIAKLRKDNNLTQEQLAELLEVSRQAVSKWESDLVFPETEKLIKLSRIFKCSIDYLLKDEETKNEVTPICCKKLEYEYISKKNIKGIPLIHISIGKKKPAKGIVAIGFRAYGLLSIGFLAIGLLSIGILALGGISIGVAALALLSFGSLSIGIMSFGAIAIGLMAIGAVAVGQISVGALAFGNYLAIGDIATANIAIASSKANGGIYEFCSNVKNSYQGLNEEMLNSSINSTVPEFFKIFSNIVLMILNL